MNRLSRWVQALSIVALLTLSLPASPAQAHPHGRRWRVADQGDQQNRRHPQRGQHPGRPRANRALARRLGLSQEQKQHMLQIQRRYQNSPDKRGMWREIRGVMTPEQFKQLKEIRQGRGQGQ